jgi:negative regulator of genetic competence, sporulation and motility
MELIVISESKLKIMLSGEDMVKYELEEERVEGCDAHTRRVFRRIFEDARAAVGFETLGERLLVQYYATGDGGGCEIFVTKLGTEDFFRAEEGGCGIYETNDIDGKHFERHKLSYTNIDFERVENYFFTFQEVLDEVSRLFDEKVSSQDEMQRLFDEYNEESEADICYNYFEEPSPSFF